MRTSEGCRCPDSHPQWNPSGSPLHCTALHCTRALAPFQYPHDELAPLCLQEFGSRARAEPFGLYWDMRANICIANHPGGAVRQVHCSPGGTAACPLPKVPLGSAHCSPAEMKMLEKPNRIVFGLPVGDLPETSCAEEFHPFFWGENLRNNLTKSGKDLNID